MTCVPLPGNRPSHPRTAIASTLRSSSGLCQTGPRAVIRRRTASPQGRRSGFSLLEIVLALALAGIALALLAQLVGLANRAAASARDLTKAQLIAEAVMAEFASGVMQPQTTTGSWELDPTWTYDAQVTAGGSDNLNVITVTVTQDVEDPNPTSFSLTQFLFIPPEPEEEETDSTATEAGGEA